MGLRERIAKAVLPPGTTTQTEQQIAGSVPHSGTRATPLPRDEELAFLPFPPASPLIPALINRPRAEGRADPRRYEFPVAWNLQIQEQRAVPFRVLRDVADQADIVRKCVEVVKSALLGQEWDISITDDAVAHVMAEQNISSLKANQHLREMMREDIAKLKDFWRSPDRINGMSFHEWLGVLLEEVLVIDALSIYPNRSYDKRLHSLEILDGATIKPLLDSRGGRPLPPNPAFQQILWGFPRGEFTAAPDADGEFTADDLVYSPKTRRPFTPYGFSPVERCLPLVDLYLKRIQWFRTEFTDGVIPDMLMKSDMDYGDNPGLLKGYEDIFNDQMAGNLEQRRRMRLLPAGFDPVITRTAEAKYSSEFDEFLIKSICGHFGVLPTQIGFTPRSGMGGSGHQTGEKDSAETFGLRPMITWIIDLLNGLSYRFLGMSHDLTFVFEDGTETDQREMAERRQIELFSGQKTWNEARTEMGLPLFDFEEADLPIVVAGRTILPLQAAFEAVAINPDGTAAPSPMEPGVEGDPPVLPPQEPKEPNPTTPHRVKPSEPVKAELATFMKWAKKEQARDFQFEYLAHDEAEVLNSLVKVDANAARELASLWKAGGFPKAGGGRERFPARHPSRAKSDRLVTLFTDRIASLGGVNPEKLVDDWLADPSDDALTWLDDHNVQVLDEAGLVAVLTDLYRQAGFMGRSAALAMALAKRIVAEDDVDWEGWKPGEDPPDFVFGARLSDVVDGVAERVRGIEETRAGMIAAILIGLTQGAISREDAIAAIEQDESSERYAEVIAATEMAYANDAATRDIFAEYGVELVDWVTSGGNSCDECLELEAASPHVLDELDEEPPIHPNCGCQLIPSESAKAMIPSLIKVRRKAIDDALAQLAAIPDVKPGLIKVPWPVVDRPKVPTDDWAGSELTLFQIEELMATQDHVKRDRVIWHLNNLGMVSPGHNSNPNVVKHDGLNKIYDGHHRLVAMWLLGAVAANCWMLEVD